MFTELQGEEKRRKETEVARMIKGGLKKRETDPASNQFPKCCPQPRTHKEIQSWAEKKRGRREIEATWWRKRRAKRGRESNQTSDLAPKKNGY